MDNRTIAKRLLVYADVLDGTDPNIYRRRAYRRAAETVLAEDRPLADLLAERGTPGLRELPGIGASLAKSLEQLIRTGELPARSSVARTMRVAVPRPDRN
jgi:DNA polymerase/3'-5' exonuclease PolX